jgi:hypothetical protein
LLDSISCRLMIALVPCGGPAKVAGAGARGRGVLAALAHELGIELSVQLDDLVGLVVLVPAPFLLRKSAGNHECRADREYQGFFLHFPRPSPVLVVS